MKEKGKNGFIIINSVELFDVFVINLINATVFAF